MKLAVTCLILLAFYFIIRIGVRAISWISGGRFRPYRLLAERYQGNYESRGMYDPPTVSFRHRDSLVRVGLAPIAHGYAESPRTRVVVRFPEGIPFRFELAPVARPAPRQEPKGTRPVTLGISLVDHDFSVRTNDPEMAREFLDSKVLSAILDLNSMVQAGGMLVSINPERLLVQADRNLGVHVDSLDRVVNDAMILHDGLMVGVGRRMAEGIDIVSPEPGMSNEEVGSPICKVCGEPIGDGPVMVCSVCRTPHHRDCWEFVGVCSIYGCNGRVGVPE